MKPVTTYLLRIDADAYSLAVDVAGDLNRDGRVDGRDSALFDESTSGLRDIDLDGSVTTADRELLVMNYGFGPGVATSSPAEQIDLVPVYSSSAAGQAVLVSPTADAAETQARTEATSETTLASPAIANGSFNQSSSSGTSFGWRTRGEVHAADGSAILTEGLSFTTTLYQNFIVPESVLALQFTIASLELFATDDQPGDAFAVSLLERLTQQPVIAGPDGLSRSDSLLNIQADGTLYLGQAVTIEGLSDTNTLPSLTDSILVTVDLTGIEAGAELRLVFDLLGFGTADSSVGIENVVILVDGSAAPEAVDDAVTGMLEDSQAIVNVLANDQVSAADFDWNTLVITSQPAYGTATVDPVYGVIRYTPDAHYSGPDSFTYAVADSSGVYSNDATVAVQIEPVADLPILTTSTVSGNQNTAIPLNLSAGLNDTDGSETLTVEITGLPAGAFLSAGTQYATGSYRLTQDQISDLTITPPLDSLDPFTLFVRAVATETNGAWQSVSSLMDVVVTAAFADPVAVANVEINNGEVQRSNVHTIAVTFNQDVSFFNGLQKDVRIESLAGDPHTIASDRYSYDSQSYTLTIDTSGLGLQDGHYLVKLSIDGIRGVADPGSRLTDIDFDPDNGFLVLGYHQLLADFTGEDYVGRNDYDAFLDHYPSRSGDDRYDPLFDLNGDGRIDSIDYRTWRRNLGTTTDTQAPGVLLGLETDSGTSAVDSLTNDCTIVGFVGDTSTIAALTVSIDGSDPIDVTAELGQMEDVDYEVNPNAFQFTRAEMEARLGSALGDGEHTIVVIATDRHGNVSPEPEHPFAFTIDTQVPTGPNAPDLLAEFDSGPSDRDDLTSSATVTIRVNTLAAHPEGSSVVLYRDGQRFAEESLAGSTCDFTNLNLGFIDGTFTFTATVLDPAGNESDLSDPLTITLDLGAPAFPTLSRHPDCSDQDATVTLIGTTQAGATVTLSRDGLPDLNTTADSAGDFSFQDVDLALGANPMTVVVTDDAGNTAQLVTSLHRFGPESNPPQISLDLQQDTSQGSLISSNSVVVGIATDDSTVAMLRLRIDGGAEVDILDWRQSDGTFELTLDRWIELTGQEPSQGDHTISLYAEDEYLNAAQTVLFSFTYDSVAPTASATPDLPSQYDSGLSDQDNITSAPSFVIVTDCEPGTVVRLYMDGTPYAQTIASQSQASFSVGPLADGAYDFHTVVEDAAGNVTISSTLTVTIDTTPIASLSFDFEGVADGNTDAERVDLVGLTEPGARVQLFRTAIAGQPIARLDAEADGTFQFEQVTIALGDNTFFVVASDLAGNSIQTGGSVYTTAGDTIPPILTAGLAGDSGVDASDGLTNDPTIAGTVDDASPIAGLLVSVDGSVEVDLAARLTDGTFILNAADLASANSGPLADDAHTIVITAIDSGGLASDPVEIEFTLDTISPTRPTTPNLVDADDTGSSQFDNVTNLSTVILESFGEPDAIVSLYVNGTLLTSNLAGTYTLLQDDSYAVIAQASDAAGNLSRFSIPLRLQIDTVAPATPSLNLNGSMLLPATPNETTSQLVDLTGTTEPEVEVFLYTGEAAEKTLVASTFADHYGQFQFDDVALAVGDNMLTAEATDTAGNTASATFSVTSNDVDPPEIALALDEDTGYDTADSLTSNPSLHVTVADSSYPCTIELQLDGLDWVAWPTDYDFHLTDYTPLLPAGESLEDGAHVVWVRATDALGQTAEQYAWFVLDTTAPTPGAPYLLPESDLGPDNSDGITNITMPWLTIDADLGDTIEWRVDGNFLGIVTITELGSQAVQVPQPLIDGRQYTITASLTDAAGNQNAVPGEFTIQIDTTPTDTFTVDLSAASDTQIVGDRRTTQEEVTLVGVTEPGAVVTIYDSTVSLDILLDSIVLDDPIFEAPIWGQVTADSEGNFEFSGVPLLIGDNVVHFSVMDVAGNISEFEQTFLRDDRPLIVMSLANDTPIGGGTDNDGLTSDPTVQGQLHGPSPVVALSAGFDGTPQEAFVDVSHSISGSEFTLTPTVLEWINGAPLSAGAHTLRLIATDTEGRASQEHTLSFVYDPGAKFTLLGSVQRDEVSGLYTYSYSLTNAAPVGPLLTEWLLQGFRVPVDASVVIDSVSSEPGWSYAYTAGDTSIQWTPDSPAASLAATEIAGFGFTTTWRLGPVTCEVTTYTQGINETRIQTAVSFGPADGAGAALYDRFDVTEGSTLQGNLLANDLGDTLSVTTVDQLFDWQTDLQWSPDGSFTYDATGSPFASLGEDEFITDRFSYTLSDGSTAFVDVTVHGVNSAPVPGADLADPPGADPVYELYVYADETLAIPFDLLLANDTDPDVNDRPHLSVTAAAGTATTMGGIAFNASGGQIVYDPTASAALDALAAGERAADTFEYTLADSHGASTQGTVTVTVLSRHNLSPEYSGEAYTVSEDGTTSISAENGLFNGTTDSDAIPGYADGLFIPAQTVTSQHGSTVLIDEDGAFAYETGDYFQSLGAGETDTDSFDFAVLDERGGETVATVNVAVQGENDVPKAHIDRFAGAYEAQPYFGSGLLDNDSDADGDHLVTFAKSDWYYDFSYMNDWEGASWSTVDAAEDFLFDPGEVLQTTTSKLGVEVTIYPDGTYRYEPNGKLDWLRAGDTETDYFQYWIHDSVSSAVAEVAVFIGPESDAPAGFAAHEVLVDQAAAGNTINNPPVAEDDARSIYVTAPTQPFAITNTDYGLLSNDHDCDLGETAALRVHGASPTGLGCITKTSQKGAAVRIYYDGRFEYDPRSSATIPNDPDLDQGITDTFKYQVVDPNGAPSAEATVTILIKEDQYYEFLSVAQTGARSASSLGIGVAGNSTEFTSLGTGPSINNNGWVAFTGTQLDGIAHHDNVYAVNLPDPSTVRSLMNSYLEKRTPEDAQQLHETSPDNQHFSSQQFGNNVQINNEQQVVAWRNLNALTMIHNGLGLPLPFFTDSSSAPAPFTYIETWDAFHGTRETSWLGWLDWLNIRAAVGLSSELHAMGDAYSLGSYHPGTDDTPPWTDIRLGNWAEIYMEWMLNLIPGLYSPIIGYSPGSVGEKSGLMEEGSGHRPDGFIALAPIPKRKVGGSMKDAIRPSFGLGPWDGARVGSHRCPILRSGRQPL